MPLRLDPGTQMKPKSKMRLVNKDNDAMSDMNRTDNSQMNHSQRVATMMS